MQLLPPNFYAKQFIEYPQTYSYWWETIHLHTWDVYEKVYIANIIAAAFVHPQQQKKREFAKYNFFEL